MRKRNYAAEYRRRTELAKSRGFRSYGAQRHAIEKGTAPAIKPGRIRTKRTADAQQKYSSFDKWAARYDGDKYRQEIAQGWSDMYARNKSIVYDSKRGKKDAAYLAAYLAAFPMSTPETTHYRRLTPSDALKHYLVNIAEIMSVGEYDDRYGENYPHAGDYGRWKNREFETKRKRNQRNYSRGYHKVVK